MINSAYGSYGSLGELVANEQKINVQPGYKHEWVVTIPPRDCIEIIQWCADTLGDAGHNRKYRWRHNQLNWTRLYLRHEEDVTLFILRWG